MKPQTECPRIRRMPRKPPPPPPRQPVPQPAANPPSENLEQAPADAPIGPGDTFADEDENPTPVTLRILHGEYTKQPHRRQNKKLRPSLAPNHQTRPSLWLHTRRDCQYH